MNKKIYHLLSILLVAHAIHAQQPSLFDWKNDNRLSFITYLGALVSVPCIAYCYTFIKQQLRRRSFTNMLANQVLEYANNIHQKNRAIFAQEINLIEPLNKGYFEKDIFDLAPDLRKECSVIAQTLIEQIYQKNGHDNALAQYVATIDAALEEINGCKLILHDKEIFLLYRKKDQNDSISKAINETLQQFSAQQFLLQTLSELLLTIRTIITKHSAYKIEALLAQKMKKPYVWRLLKKITRHNNTIDHTSTKSPAHASAPGYNDEFLKTVSMVLNDSTLNNSLRSLTKLV